SDRARSGPSGRTYPRRRVGSSGLRHCPWSDAHTGHIVGAAAGAAIAQIDIVGITDQSGPVGHEVSLSVGQQDAYVGLVELARRSRCRSRNFAKRGFADDLNLL